MVKVKEKFICGKCGSMYDNKNTAEYCCPTEDLEAFRDSVYEEFYKPLCDVMTPKVYHLSIIGIPSLYMELVTEVDLDLINFDVARRFDEYDVLCGVNVDFREDATEDVTASVLTIFGKHPSFHFSELLSDIGTDELVDTLSDLCGDVTPIIKHIDSVVDTLKKLDEKYETASEVYKSIVELFLYEPTEHVLSLKQDELLKAISYDG